MINPSNFYTSLTECGINFFCGVPDSLLKEFCACITDKTSNQENIITVNEGNALAVAAGHYLATGKPAVVYMQNSGLGNIVNPLLSLTDEEVYNIPALLMIGWRGEPGVQDEPQHITQGMLTLPLLDTLGIRHEILESTSQLKLAYDYMMATKKPFAFVVHKGTFEGYQSKVFQTEYPMTREAAIRQVVSCLDQRDIIVSTTGMISRELYENRTSHEKDFLTVGSMGHASSIAFGIALACPDRQVFCFDGDGAFLMHMGAAAVAASRHLANFKHIVFNNEAHDSVGAQPTVAAEMNLSEVAKACGYAKTFIAETSEQLAIAWSEFYTAKQTSFLEIRVQCGARKNLGRPKEKPVENKIAFMEFLKD